MKTQNQQRSRVRFDFTTPLSGSLGWSVPTSVIANLP
jgi:hypothetical protein